MRKTYFKAWHNEGLSNLTTKAFADYCSRLKKVERVLRIDLDKVPLSSSNRVLEAIQEKNFPKLSKEVLSDCKSGVRKYWEFRKYMRKTFG